MENAPQMAPKPTKVMMELSHRPRRLWMHVVVNIAGLLKPQSTLFPGVSLLSDQQADARDAAGIDVAHPPTGVQPLGRDAVVHCLRPRRRSLVVPPLCRAGDRQTQWCGETRKDPVVDMSARACAGEVAVQGWCGGDVTIRGDSERVRRSPVVAPVEKMTSSAVPRGDGPPPLLVSAGGCSPPASDPRRFVPPLGRHLHHRFDWCCSTKSLRAALPINTQT
ncbi:hypothetical protein B296_00036612 [Ensete ventricosum]|uniref:Uncharacterized protein n=1 Tax=Ensete ventricosum TaxID=4639 RepID=A0A427A240_ENSVE|nr:hypothetical protein B296_00036612 [Ensete ventricosum]